MGVLSSRELHFAPGRGPFHVKGTAYLGLLDHYSRNLPRGIEPVLAQFEGDDELIAFFRQRFLAGSWYDVGPSVLLSRAAATVFGVPHLELLREQARAQAARDIHGVYRLLLKLTSPEKVMTRLPRAANRYFDFVRAEVREVEPGAGSRRLTASHRWRSIPTWPGRRPSSFVRWSSPERRTCDTAGTQPSPRARRMASMSLACGAR